MVLLVIAGGLCVAAVLLLTVPWGRRDAADFSAVEVGYAARGPRGGLRAAARQLKRDGLVEVRPRLDMIERKDKRLPKDADPLTRAVFEALRHHHHDHARLLDDAGVSKELQAVGDRVQRAGLRVGPARRLGGVALALAAPVVVLIGVAHDVHPVPGIFLAVALVLVAVVTLRLNGTTVGGRRTFDAARLRYAIGTRRPVRSAGAMGAVGVGGSLFGDTYTETPGGYGGFDGGGGGGGGGGDSGSGY